jgi:hypothetical protein
MSTKQCTRCLVTKSSDQFSNDKYKPDGKRPECKECKSKRDKIYREKNLEKKREQDRIYAKEHAEEAKIRAKQWYENNKEKAKQTMQEYRKNNADKIKECKARYNELHKKKMRAWFNDYMKYKYATNLNYKIKSILNKRIRDFVRSKDKPTLDYLGCSLEIFKKWIEFHFDENMSWDNLGSYWHFDHVKPCASFDFSVKEHIFECYNWKNLRPLEKKENISKGSKIDNVAITKQLQLVIDFELLCVN